MPRRRYVAATSHALGAVWTTNFVFVGGLMNKSTGNVLNVDGGVAMAFVR